ncbi:MAG: hypothetical protein A2045_00865 [Rhodocyclales bacterium GWA2_65_20]|nr:MAG: hypothetical protein A2045_00865 [Rhodocyclales bacterium GWA2_65_20]
MIRYLVVMGALLQAGPILADTAAGLGERIDMCQKKPDFTQCILDGGYAKNPAYLDAINYALDNDTMSLADVLSQDGLDRYRPDASPMFGVRYWIPK